MDSLSTEEQKLALFFFIYTMIYSVQGTVRDRKVLLLEWIIFHEYLVYAHSGIVLNFLCFSPFYQADCETTNGYLVEMNTKQEADFV